MIFEPARYSKFEVPRGSLIIPKPIRKPKTTMRNVTNATNVEISASTGTIIQQLKAEDEKTYFSKYFSVKSLAVLSCITISLLVLPLVLPPLSPPPSLLLLVPIGILIVLLVLAFKYSSHAPHVTGLYM